MVFSFQILGEIRHLIMDLGYGFELRTTKITGLIVIFGSIVFNSSFLFNWKNFFKMIKATKKWIF